MKSLPWLVSLAVAACGCATPRLPEFGARYAPANVHAASALPGSIRRVAVLPLAPHRADSLLVAAAEALSGTIEVELRKTGAFEVVIVSEGQLQIWTGRRQWRADETLPRDFLVRLRKETGCDAVLFPALTAFQAYPPLVVGLDLRLVACDGHATVWAVDEILDAGAGPVARSARDYGRSQTQGHEGGEGAVLQSPTCFARFASATLMGTLPPRQNSLKRKSNSTITEAEKQP